MYSLLLMHTYGKDAQTALEGSQGHMVASADTGTGPRSREQCHKGVGT